MTPEEQLKVIFAAVAPLYRKRDQVFQEVEHQLRAYGITHLPYDQLEKSERKTVRQYYEAFIQPVLSPQIIDTHHPFPHLANGVIHVGVKIQHKNREVFGVVPMPASLPALFYLRAAKRGISAWKTLSWNMPISCFPPSRFWKRSCSRDPQCRCQSPMTRSLQTNRIFASGEKALHQRQRLAPVRLELSGPISKKFAAYMMDKLKIAPEQDLHGRGPHEDGICLRTGRQTFQVQTENPELSQIRPRLAQCGKPPQEPPAAGAKEGHPPVLPL